jgi:hypothetical protein
LIEQVETTSRSRQLSIWSGIMLFSSLTLAPAVTWWSMSATNTVFLAVGLLAIPATLAAWIYITVAGVHSLGTRYWSLRSTYVSLVMSGIALGLLCLDGIFLLLSKNTMSDSAFTVLPISSLILLGCTMLWSGWFNYRKTESLLLATSITLIQSLSAVALVIWIFLAIAKRKEHDDT